MYIIDSALVIKEPFSAQEVHATQQMLGLRDYARDALSIINVLLHVVYKIFID